MIKAQHNKIFEFIFLKYLYFIFKQNFHSINLIKNNDLTKNNFKFKNNNTKNIIFVQNHSYWWDGFIAYIVNQKLFGYKYFVMMLNKQLQKFPMFKYIGAFSIEPTSSKSIIESINYSIDILNQNKNNSLLIFPQGTTKTDFNDEFELKNGLFEILKKYFKSNPNESIYICIIFTKIYSGNNQKPELFIQNEIFEIDKTLKIDNVQLDNLFLTNKFKSMKLNIQNTINEYEINKIQNFDTLIKGKSRTSN
ncbi:MAG: 1-acyl-sn-glycerol-3-phosphate acyltransferase [Candidatus Kapaibacteriota bacterium]|jgi:1-acyl-sn-glycerol-3-phosphate acyltransferase